MRREKAIAIIVQRQKRLEWSISDADLAAVAKCDVDCFVALGMLKLDEPKSAEDRAIEVFEAATSDPRCGPHQLLTRLEACGLKIVHK